MQVGEERSIVSAMSGTTRDAIDTELTLPDGKRFTLIDTAGIRKRTAVASSDDGAEPLSVNRALQAIRSVVFSSKGPLWALNAGPWRWCNPGSICQSRVLPLSASVHALWHWSAWDLLCKYMNWTAPISCDRTGT